MNFKDGNLAQQSSVNLQKLEEAEKIRQFHLDQFIQSDALLKSVQAHQKELEKEIKIEETKKKSNSNSKEEAITELSPGIGQGVLN